MFETGFKAKQANLRESGALTHWFWDFLVFRKVALSKNISSTVVGSVVVFVAVVWTAELLK